jgi:hypothetical protein
MSGIAKDARCCVLLSHVAVPLRRSPTLPPGLRYVTGHYFSKGNDKILVVELWCVLLRSVDTPVDQRPVDATAREPPRSTRLASVPPWIVCRRFCVIIFSWNYQKL